MKKFEIIASLLLLCSPLAAVDTEFTHTIQGDGVEISAPATHDMGTAQTLQGTFGSSVYVDALAAVPFEVGVLDKRGVTSPLLVNAELTALVNENGNVRPTTLLAQNATGNNTEGITFADSVEATTSTPVAVPALVNATGAVNRSFVFEVALSAAGLSGESAESGSYTGKLVLSVE